MRAVGPPVMAALCAALPASAVELKNDSFTTEGNASFQAGFVAGEIGAARFVPGPGSWRLTHVRLLFGPSGSAQSVTVRVWADEGGTAAPGTELMAPSTQSLTPDITVIQEIDLSPFNVTVTGPFRVGVEFSHSGVPSIASDADGISAGRNFILASGLGWFDAAALGVTGDWILRAEVVPVGSSEDAGIPDAGSAPDAGPPPDAGEPPDAGAPVTCRLNSDCLNGQFCNEGGSCDFECRVALDCAQGMECSSIGKCVAAEETSSGCGCGAGASGVASLLAGVIWVLSLRRRHRRSATA